MLPISPVSNSLPISWISINPTQGKAGKLRTFRAGHQRRLINKMTACPVWHCSNQSLGVDKCCMSSWTLAWLYDTCTDGSLAAPRPLRHCRGHDTSSAKWLPLPFNLLGWKLDRFPTEVRMMRHKEIKTCRALGYVQKKFFDETFWCWAGSTCFRNGTKWVKSKNLNRYLLSRSLSYPCYHLFYSSPLLFY